jgi:hypothetical protein
VLDDFQRLLGVTDADVLLNEEERQRDFAEARKTAPGPLATGDTTMRRGLFLADRALELHMMRFFFQQELRPFLEMFIGCRGPAGIVAAYVAGDGPPPAYAAWIVAIADGESWNDSDGSLFRAQVLDWSTSAFLIVALAIQRGVRNAAQVATLCLETGLSARPRWGGPPAVVARVSRLFTETRLFAYFEQTTSSIQIPGDSASDAVLRLAKTNVQDAIVAHQAAEDRLSAALDGARSVLRQRQTDLGHTND